MNIMFKNLIEKQIQRIKKQNKKRKILLILIVGLILTIIFYQIFLSKKKTDFELFTVTQGNIIQEIFETGQVQKGEKINLGFKAAGQIKEVYVQIGDEVEVDELLAVLDNTDSEIQFQEALAVLEFAKLNLNKLLIGATQEERETSQARFKNAQTNLLNAENNLKNSYQSGLNVLDGSLGSIDSALDFSRYLVRQYIVVHDGDARKITQARDQIESASNNARNSLSLARNSLTEQDIKNAISVTKNSLEICLNSLEIIRSTINQSTVYHDRVSTADKASLETLKENTNLALSNVITADQSISSMELNLATTQKNLIENENQLKTVTGQAQQIDINLSQAQIKQAQARVNFYQNQIKQSKLVSPIKGKIAEIKKRPGETVQPNFQDPVFIILPVESYEIKTDIYEGDIVKINLGDKAEISLVAFPEKKFQGKVISINPAEKIIDQVVYYETLISFNDVPENIMPGMTADIIIKINLKENVLIVHRDAVQRKNSKRMVEVFKDNKTQEREIETGARGIDNMEEIIFGLEQGEKVLIRK